MNIDHIYEKLSAAASVVKKAEVLSGYTTFKVGGPADYLVEPASVEELQAVMDIVYGESVPYIVLGNGSNVLVKDDGFRGVVIVIGAGLGDIQIDAENAIITAGAGAMLGEAARAAARESLSGLEFASGIPGSIGGGAFMNAGAYGGEMSHVITGVDALMPDGSIRHFAADELDFGYRHSIFYENGGIIVSVEMKLEHGNQNEINEKMTDLNHRRAEKQPLNFPSAGSTFKRPSGYFAGQLIEESGLKGHRIGGAMVSEKHAGFVINYDHATSKDILNLIDHIKSEVYMRFGVELEPEIKIIGKE